MYLANLHVIIHTVACVVRGTCTYDLTSVFELTVSIHIYLITCQFFIQSVIICVSMLSTLTIINYRDIMVTVVIKFVVVFIPKPTKG